VYFQAIEFRRETMNDAELLLSWRNDPITLANSFNADLAIDEHIAWLSGSLARILYRFDLDGGLVGTLREDWERVSNTWKIEVSFTIAPEHRGKGDGKEMLQQYVSLSCYPLTARIKEFNLHPWRS